MACLHSERYARTDLRPPFRRRVTAPDPVGEKPLLVTIRGEGDQFHTWNMGPGDAVGLGGIRVDIGQDGQIIVSPITAPVLTAA